MHAWGQGMSRGGKEGVIGENGILFSQDKPVFFPPQTPFKVLR